METNNETIKMLEIWRKWEAAYKDIGLDLAVTSAMHEYAIEQIKNLDLHIVNGSILGQYADGTLINMDGLQICEVCGSTNITDPIPNTENGNCNDCGFHW